MSGGYHLNEITKGVLGEISKIQEEVNELLDAEQQNSVIMIGCELSDLYGAVEAYAQKYNLTMNDLSIMSNITKRAFEVGERCSSTDRINSNVNAIKSLPAKLNKHNSQAIFSYLKNSTITKCDDKDFYIIQNKLDGYIVFDTSELQEKHPMHRVSLYVEDKYSNLVSNSNIEFKCISGNVRINESVKSNTHYNDIKLSQGTNCDLYGNAHYTLLTDDDNLNDTEPCIIKFKILSNQCDNEPVLTTHNNHDDMKSAVWKMGVNSLKDAYSLYNNHVLKNLDFANSIISDLSDVNKVIFREVSERNIHGIHTDDIVRLTREGLDMFDCILYNDVLILSSKHKRRILFIPLLVNKMTNNNLEYALKSLNIFLSSNPCNKYTFKLLGKDTDKTFITVNCGNADDDYLTNDEFISYCTSEKESITSCELSASHRAVLNFNYKLNPDDKTITANLPVINLEYTSDHEDYWMFKDAEWQNDILISRGIGMNSINDDTFFKHIHEDDVLYLINSDAEIRTEILNIIDDSLDNNSNVINDKDDHVMNYLSNSSIIYDKVLDYCIIENQLTHDGFIILNSNNPLHLHIPHDNKFLMQYVSNIVLVNNIDRSPISISDAIYDGTNRIKLQRSLNANHDEPVIIYYRTVSLLKYASDNFLARKPNVLFKFDANNVTLDKRRDAIEKFINDDHLPNLFTALYTDNSILANNIKMLLDNRTPEYIRQENARLHFKKYNAKEEIGLLFEDKPLGSN